MNIKIDTKTIHQKEIFAFIPHKDLEFIVADYVAKQNSIRGTVSIGAHGTKYTVEFQDATEGSPAYKIGTSAKVKIIQDFEAPPEEAK